jgi:DNA-binding CsgD family transcriptional regulator
MAASGPLRERDLRALTAVVEDGLRDDPGPAMPWAVLGRLLQLVPCEGVSFNELNVRERQPIALQGLGDDGVQSIECDFTDEEKPPYPDYWPHRESFLPSSYLDRTGDVTTVLRWSDFYTTSELRTAPFHAEYMRPMGTKYGIYVPLPAGPGRSRRLVLGRKSGPDFSDHELLILRLLRPHLHEVYLDAARRRHGVPHFSRREREVLQLVSQGYSNADIARILFISVATVRKHLENIFNRTGVHTRNGAVALAMPHLSPFAHTADAEERR